MPCQLDCPLEGALMRILIMIKLKYWRVLIMIKLLLEVHPVLYTNFIINMQINV